MAHLLGPWILGPRLWSSPMSDGWAKLATRTGELEDLAHVIRLAHWDQEVMMPPKGGPARARALSTLQGIAHERLTSPEIGKCLEELEDDGSLDTAQQASVRILRREYDKATKIPERLVKDLAAAEATAYQVWTKARPADDFAMLQPHLETIVRLKKEQADAVGWEAERYDALLDDFEPGMKTSEVEVLFEGLRRSLRPLVDSIVEAAGSPPEFLRRSYAPNDQHVFCDWLVQRLQFDTEGGRLDSSPHPFTMGIALGDVRQTTKAHADALMSSIYAAIHETGHALYEQNLPEKLHGLPAGQVPSLGMHESQSRLWENQVGRSKAFTSFMLGRLKEQFPEQLHDVDSSQFFRGANHAERSLIRITSDEVTYNLHVGLRFELEIALFRDELEVADLPGAWNDAMQDWVGVLPPNDSDGVLQDMHWSIGAIGYFPTYTLGTLYAAAFFDRASSELGGLDEELGAGDVSRLLGWLRENIHERAYLYPAKELGEMVLGGPLTPDPFLEHVRRKFGDLYDLDLSTT